MSEKRQLTVQNDTGRLDAYLAEQMDMSRSRIKNAVSNGDITVNGSKAKPSVKLKKGDVVCVQLYDAQPVEIEAQDIPIDILFQDEDIAVINKSQGLVVHPAPGNYNGTLVNALVFHLKDLSGINGEIRPGIVHRIDKDTSGVLVIAKNDDAHASLAQQIASKSARRIYIAVVHGNIKEDEITIDKAIARSKRDRKKMAIDTMGRQATTKIRVLERFGEFTLVEAELTTGRTHQIRVHLKSINRPVAGDTVYGPKTARLHSGGQLLHAKTLMLTHPRTGEQMTFDAPLPDYFEKALKILRMKQSQD
jgi:23S rRNA pseudouridine1911/1915/1917 synthase